MFKRNELRLLWPFYLQSLFLSLSKLIMPFYVLYFLGIGLNFFQIAIIGSVRSIVSILFEAPTGAIADIFGRKTSVILGYLLSSLTLLLIFFAHNFYVIIIIFAFDALFETLVSGADRAWAVDLLESKQSKLVDTYFIRSRLFRNIGLIIAPILAGVVIGRMSMSYLWLFYAIGTFLSTMFLFFGKEVNPGENLSEIITVRESELKNFVDHIKQSFHLVSKSKILPLMFLAIFIFYFVEETTGLAWTPYLEKIGVALPMIGYLFSAIAIIGVIIPFVTERLLKYKSKLYVLFFTMLVYAILLIFVGFINLYLLIILVFVLFNSAEEIFLPLEDALTNFYLESKNRATILSFKSMVESFASIIGGPVAGYLLDILSLRQAIVFSGAILLTIPVLYSVIRSRGRASARPSE